MRVSSLVIEPDQACHARAQCLCTDPGIAADTLRVSELGADDMYSISTVGYDYGSDEVGRHTLAYQIWDDGGEWDVLTMAHELGHSIGFYHEHQRPDRDRYVDYHCEGTDGYPEAVALVRNSGAASGDMNPALSLAQKMDKVCTEGHWAEKYLPWANEFMRVDGWTDVHVDFEMSSDYDIDSIMHYASRSGRYDDAADNGQYMVALTRKPPHAAYEIFQGGHWDPQLAGPSWRDVARVAEMYPRRDAAGGSNGSARRGAPRVSDAQRQHQGRYRVVLDGVTTTVGPVPEYTPLDPGKSKDKKILDGLPKKMPIDRLLKPAKQP